MKPSEKIDKIFKETIKKKYSSDSDKLAIDYNYERISAVIQFLDELMNDVPLPTNK